MRLWLIAMLPGMAFGNASSTIVGQNMGASDFTRARKSGWISAGIYFFVAVAMTVLFLILAGPLTALFNSRADIVAAGSECLRWISLTFVFLGISIVLGRSMNGAGDTFWPMMITAVALLAVRIPVSYALSTAWKSPTGIWAGLVVSGAVQAILFIIVYRWGRWEKIGARLINHSNDGL